MGFGARTRILVGAEGEGDEGGKVKEEVLRGEGSDEGAVV